MNKIIVVNFDNTLVYTCDAELDPKYYEVRDYNLNLHNYLRKEHNNGATIILWTCRTGELLQEAIKWCKDNNIPIDYINEHAP